MTYSYIITGLTYSRLILTLAVEASSSPVRNNRNHFLLCSKSRSFCLASIKCAKSSQFMLVRRVSRWAMPVGNCIALSMGSSPMVRCPETRHLVWIVMIRSIPSSLRHPRANMCQEPSLLTWSQLSLV